jgi:hypothetical protein
MTVKCLWISRRRGTLARLGRSVRNLKQVADDLQAREVAAGPERGH